MLNSSGVPGSWCSGEKLKALVSFSPCCWATSSVAKEFPSTHDFFGSISLLDLATFSAVLIEPCDVDVFEPEEVVFIGSNATGGLRLGDFAASFECLWDFLGLDLVAVAGVCFKLVPEVSFGFLIVLNTIGLIAASISCVFRFAATGDDGG